MPESLHYVDWFIIFLYLFIVVIGGSYFTRRAHRGLSEYFLSGRNLPWWIAGTSMVATSFSCDTPLYVTKLVRTQGIYENWQWWSFMIGGMFSAFLLSKMWRRAEVLTDVELTELRYSGKSAAILRGFRAFYLAIPINCIAMGWVLLAMAKISAAVLGWGKWESIVIFSMVAFCYSLLAGFWGVVVTDVLQFVLAIAGAVMLAYYAVDAAGGLPVIIDFIRSQPEKFPETLNFIPSIKSSTTGLISAAFIGFLTYNLVQWWANINSDGGGKVIQRISACKNENHALGAVLWYNFAHFVLRSWPWVIAALASLVLYPELTDAESAYPKMVMEILPVGVKGLVIASLVAAFMSTIDTQMNWGSSYLTSDLYRRFINKNATEKHYLWAAKIFVVLMVTLAGLCAYFTDSVTEAFRFIIAFSAGTGPIYILRWFWWRINAWSEISAMIASSIISISLYTATNLEFAEKILITAAGSAAVWIAVAFVTPSVRKENLEEFYRRVRPGGFWGPIKNKLEIAPESLKTGVINSLLGVTACAGFTFSIGKLLLNQLKIGFIIMLIACVSSIVLYKRLKPEKKYDIQL